MTISRRKARGDDRSERGVALIGVMMLLMIVGAAAAAVSVSGRTELLISRNHESAAQARASAEAGLNHASQVTLAVVTPWLSGGFASAPDAMTSLLLGPDGLAGTPAADADNGSLVANGIPTPPARTTLPGGSQYDARLLDEDDPARGLILTTAEVVGIGEDLNPVTDANSRIAVQATGYAADGTTKTLEALVVPSGNGKPAILSDGPLEITGNADVVGLGGSIHTNDDLDLDGNAVVDGYATASGAYDQQGSASVGGMAGGGLPQQGVPDIHAIDYKPLADFILRSDGVMTDQVGTVICDASGNPNACRNAGYMWSYGGTGWSMNTMSATGDNRTYYVEGDASMGGNTGTNGNPLNITVIAEGNIELLGGGVLEANTPGLLFVTDKDFRKAGGKDQVGQEAQILVREQAHLGGTGSILGQVVIQDEGATSNLVTSNTVLGDITISNSGTIGDGGTFEITGWREVT